MSILYHNDTIIKKEKELLRALLIQFCKLELTELFRARDAYAPYEDVTVKRFWIYL